MEPHTSSNRNVPSNDDSILAVKHNKDSDLGKTIIRVCVEHGVQISLNSLVAPAVTSFFQDMFMNVSQMFPSRRTSS